MRFKEDLLIVVTAVLVSLFLVGISPKSEVLAQTSCDIDCLNQKIIDLTIRVIALEHLAGTSAKTTVTTPSQPVKTTAVYKNIGGGSSIGFDWTKVPGSDFSFDQSLYGNVAYVTWQGWMENGTGSVRLFDKTNGRAVDGSEIALNASERASFYSGILSIWRGQNQYYVQVKNVNGQIVTISGARLRVVTK